RGDDGEVEVRDANRAVLENGPLAEFFGAFCIACHPGDVAEIALRLRMLSVWAGKFLFKLSRRVCVLLLLPVEVAEIKVNTRQWRGRLLGGAGRRAPRHTFGAP